MTLFTAVVNYPFVARLKKLIGFKLLDDSDDACELEVPVATTPIGEELATSSTSDVGAKGGAEVATSSSGSEVGASGGAATARPGEKSGGTQPRTKPTSGLTDSTNESGIRNSPEFTSDPLNSRGMKLGFVSPMIKNGEKCVQLQTSDITPEIDKWVCSCVFYVVGMNPSLNAVRIYAQNQWGGIPASRIFLHDDGYFLIRFDSNVARNDIIVKGPYMFKGKPVVVRPWSVNFDFQSEVLREVPVWVRFPNLPLYCWAGNSLSRIGSALGVPICTDECTSHQSRISYARMLIEIDVTKSRPKAIPIEGVNGVEFEQKVTYEWVPHFCSKCNKVGHDCYFKRITTGAAKKKKTKPKRAWVRKQQQQQAPNCYPCPPDDPLDNEEGGGLGPTQQLDTGTGEVTPFTRQQQQQGECSNSDVCSRSGDEGNEEPFGSDIAHLQQHQQMPGPMAGMEMSAQRGSKHAGQKQQQQGSPDQNKLLTPHIRGKNGRLQRSLNPKDQC
ncbi:hypothetical protein RDABS01_021884 [Bienertia sinuspersici]